MSDVLNILEVKNTINNWSCKACKAFPHVTATTFHGKSADANGFVAYDADANEIIVAFAGTDPLSIKNWIDDLNFIQTDYPYCNGCKVHQGFLNSFNSVIAQVKSLVSSAVSQHPSAKLSVTGHSLGAAMAAHCTAELAHSGYNLTASYTYGMPRVGNDAFQKWYKASDQSKVKGTYRVVHDHDPVPHVPLEGMSGGFHHMPYEVFYERDYNKWVQCNVDGEDSKCSDKFLTDLNVGESLVAPLSLSSFSFFLFYSLFFYIVLFVCVLLFLVSQPLELFGFRLHNELPLLPSLSSVSLKTQLKFSLLIFCLAVLASINLYFEVQYFDFFHEKR